MGEGKRKTSIDMHFNRSLLIGRWCDPVMPEMPLVGIWIGKSIFFAAFGLFIGNTVAGLLSHVEVKDYGGVHSQAVM